MVAEYRTGAVVGAGAMVWALTGRIGLASRAFASAHAPVATAEMRTARTAVRVFIASLPLQGPVRSRLELPRTRAGFVGTGRPCPRGRPAVAGPRAGEQPGPDRGWP